MDTYDIAIDCLMSYLDACVKNDEKESIEETINFLIDARKYGDFEEILKKLSKTLDKR
jgi:F0F1-type ATP synthase delta subunit